MRCVPKGAYNKWMRVVHNGGLRRQRAWLVMAAGEVRRGGGTQQSAKRGTHREQGTNAQRMATAVRAMAAATAEARRMVVAYDVERVEAMAVAVTMTMMTIT